MNEVPRIPEVGELVALPIGSKHAEPYWYVRKISGSVSMAILHLEHLLDMKKTVNVLVYLDKKKR